MKKKNLLVLGLASLLSLVSCGGGDDDTVVDQYLPVVDPSYQVEFEFWHCLGHEKTKNLEIIANNFNSKYAGKYHVNLVHPAGDYASLHDVVKQKIAANEIPALTMGYPDSFSEYITEDISNSFLLRIDNFIKDANYGFPTAQLADFVPGYLAEGNQYQFTGFWSMPMYKSTEVMYYNYSYFMGCNPCNANKFATNVEFLAKYNKVVGRTLEGDLTLDADLQDLKAWLVEHDGYVYDVPEKWDDAVALGRKMISDRYVEGVTAEFYPFGYDSDSNLLISQMAQLNIPYTVNNAAALEDPTAHIQFNNSAAQWLVNDIVSLLDQKILITKNSLGGTIYTNTYFNEGKCAFTVGSTGGSSYNISSNFAVKLAKVPYRGTTPRYIQQGPSICFFDKGDAFVHKGAWLFYKEMSDSVNNANFALENSYDPIRFSSYETAEYKEWISHKGEGLKYDIPAMTAELRNQNVYMTSPVFVGSSTCREEIGNIISYIYGSKMDTATAFGQAYDNCVIAVK